MKFNFALLFAAVSVLKSVHGLTETDQADCDGHPGEFTTSLKRPLYNNNNNNKESFPSHILATMQQTHTFATFTAPPLISKVDAMSSW